MFLVPESWQKGAYVELERMLNFGVWRLGDYNNYGKIVKGDESQFLGRLVGIFLIQGPPGLPFPAHSHPSLLALRSPVVGWHQK